MKEIKTNFKSPLFSFPWQLRQSLSYRFQFFLAYLIPLDVIVGLFTVVCGSFWHVDKIQNGITMETEVPK
jgi:hypothetical protein